jgi:hypothetical protein
VTASTNLHRLADDLAALPADALERIEDAADRIVTAAAPVSSMRGHKNAGLPVRMARNQHPKLSASTATFRVQGTVPGWLWLNSGTRPHRIPRRHRGNKARLYLKHPGSRGRRAWRRVVTELQRTVPQIVTDEIARVVR